METVIVVLLFWQIAHSTVLTYVLFRLYGIRKWKERHISDAYRMSGDILAEITHNRDSIDALTYTIREYIQKQRG